jgi:AAA domain/Protein of unknown function (DUF4011)
LERQEKIKRLLTQYLRRLTNLSGNNRSLFLPRLGSEQFLDVHAASQFNFEKSFSIVEALIAKKKKTICPVADPRIEESNNISRKLKKLQRLDQFLFEERGSNDLHLAWPFVRGKFSDGTLVRCPLLFFPVELVVENHHWVIQLRDDADITFNKSFLLAYAFYNQVKADEDLLEETFEDVDRDATVFRTAIYQLLQGSGMGIHFNPDNYRDELTAFVTYTKTEFEEQHKNGELKLFPEAVIGIFPQAGSYLVPDYIDLIDNNRISDLEEFFIDRNTTGPLFQAPSNFISLVKEEKVYSIFGMDVWQENALKAVKLGNSMVVQGPPGTGKSQLICNLISDGLAVGKRILVVCQKRAALDVVYERMHKQNLSPFLGLVHDFKNDRKGIYEKIASQIERVDEYITRNNSLDAIQLERKFYQTGRRIDQITDELEEFREALFDEKECGTCIKELYLSSFPDEPVINIKQEFQHFRFDPPDFLGKLKTYAHYADKFEHKKYPWYDRKSFGSHQLSDLRSIQEHLKAIPVFFTSLSGRLHEICGTTFNWNQCEALLDRKTESLEIVSLIDSEERFKYLLQMLPESDEETSSLWLSNTERVIVECFQGEGPEVSVELAQLGQFQEALRRSMKARRSLIGMIRWKLFSKDKILITRALVANGLKSNKEGFQQLEEKLDTRLNLEHNLSKVKTKKWLTDVPEDYKLVTFQHWSQNQQRAIKAKLIFNSIRGIKNFISPAHLTLKDLRAKLISIFQILEEIPLQRSIWLNYFTVNQVSNLTAKKEYSEGLLKNIKSDFDALIEFDRLKESMDSDEKNIVARLHEKSEGWEYHALEKLFLNSLSLAWIEHIENKHPVLRIVSSEKLFLLEAELHDNIVDKQSISSEILMLRAREQVTRDLEFNRLNNRVTYRDLLHQVTKKKKIWPLRKVIHEFEIDIFKLVPCWLASPESVSAIFPMREMFDLVIFDEASQCFAERGIPAMYRGKQVVVAGDDKQLRPSDLYNARWQEDGSDHPDLEAESLLELCNRYLLKADLRSHYRSQSLPLIDFSNQHFYQGRLTLLPDRDAVNKPEPSIEYIKIDGNWEDNTNPAEAEKIIELIGTLAKTHPGKSIGIVTFNAPQQDLILDLLDERSMARQIDIPKDLFVKNIENVQGDEKDIIIFSVGYAPDKKGKLRAQFGSLNQAGGENRLNVAVTRARERIILVTSIWPEELHVEDALNPGPKLLKAYLAYVRNVSNGQFKPFVAPSTAPLRLSLKQKIKEWGGNKFTKVALYENDLPGADLTIRVDQLSLGIIITDDEHYKDSISAKERHGTLPALLEQKHWKFMSCYSRRYWQDPDKFFNDVGKFVGQ